MDNLDLQVLTQAQRWLKAGRRAWLVTVVETWGSAPRVPGALLGICEDGSIVGSVSGGCVEDDLIERVRLSAPVGGPTLLAYGVSKDEAARFGLPCGGTLRLVQEPLQGAGWVEEVVARSSRRELITRVLDLSSGETRIDPVPRTDAFSFDGRWMRQPFGPRWRLLVVGAGQLSRLVSSMALSLDFAVTCCDPREEYGTDWDLPGVALDRSMPDDLVLALELDAHSAVVALSHDPKMDDMVLLEALRSPAFYVGALGSRVNTSKRKERLALLGMAADEIERLHGPIGLDLGAKTPAEIAVSVLAELVAVRNGTPLLQKKSGSSVPRSSAASSASPNQDVVSRKLPI